MTSSYRVIKVNTCTGTITLERESAMPTPNLVWHSFEAAHPSTISAMPRWRDGIFEGILREPYPINVDDRVDTINYSFRGRGTWNLVASEREGFGHTPAIVVRNWNAKWLKMWRQVAEAHDHYCFCTEKEWCYKDGEFYKLHATSEEG